MTWDSFDLMMLVVDGAPVSRAMAAAGPAWMRTRRPQHLRRASLFGPSIANCQDPHADPEVADILQTTPQFVRHAGVHFNAEVWWEDDLFHSVVWVYGQPRGYHHAPVLADLVRAVNDQWEVGLMRTRPAPARGRQPRGFRCRCCGDHSDVPIEFCSAHRMELPDERRDVGVAAQGATGVHRAHRRRRPRGGESAVSAPRPRSPRLPRVPERAVQSQIRQLLASIGAHVYVLGTVRPKGGAPGTRQTPGWCGRRCGGLKSAKARTAA